MTSTTPPADASARRRGGPPPVLALIVVLGLLAGIALIVIQTLGPTTAAPLSTPAPVAGAAGATVAHVIDVLGGAQLQAAASDRPYRPPETPALTTAPRAVVQVVLPQDPAHGFIVVYELSGDAQAASVGREYAAYLASGPGRINFPMDTRFSLRRVGSTLVFFSWSPENWPDPRSGDIATALDQVGEGIPVPS
jgi:hypothetical protein